MSLSLNTLKPAKGSKRYPKRLGRGNASGKGTTGGRGGKGQTARTGGRNKLKLLGMRHIILATPKLRGFQSMYAKMASVGIDAVAAAFKSGESVNPKSLRAKGLISAGANGVKILGGAPLKKRLVIVGCQVSESAKEKIVAAGGEIKA